MNEYLTYRCKKHPKTELVKGELFSWLLCPKCDVNVYDRWCEKCNDWAGYMGPHTHCPKCGSPPKKHELRNHSMKWHDGDVHCLKCETRVRSWDAG